MSEHDHAEADPATNAESSCLAKLAAAIPTALASRAHQLILLALGAWLIGVPLLLPFIGWAQPSARAELIGGNWTNVSSALGACIAAGAGMRSLQEHHAHHLAEEARRKTAEATHELLLLLHGHLGGTAETETPRPNDSPTPANTALQQRPPCPPTAQNRPEEPTP